MNVQGLEGGRIILLKLWGASLIGGNGCQLGILNV